MFKLSNLEEEDAIDLLQQLIMAGIPPTAIAIAFDLEVDFVRGIANELRVRRYGTSEISEAMAWLMWEAYDEAVKMLHSGSPANRIRAIAMILPRSVGMAARQDPEEFGRLRSRMEELIASQTAVNTDDDEQSEFVV